MLQILPNDSVYFLNWRNVSTMSVIFSRALPHTREEERHFAPSEKNNTEIGGLNRGASLEQLGG